VSATLLALVSSTVTLQPFKFFILSSMPLNSHQLFPLVIRSYNHVIHILYQCPTMGGKGNNLFIWFFTFSFSSLFLCGKLLNHYLNTMFVRERVSKLGFVV
jgi:hypothetical protein